jgi:hypothetical protein
MHGAKYAVCALTLLLAACAADPVVTGDSRGYFDTVKGLAGGNEFDARAPEGKVQYAGAASPGSAPAGAAAAPAPARSAAPAGVPAAPAAPASAAAAPAMAAAAAPSAAPPETRIGIDANAFAAVFGTAAGAVAPTAEQLMRLDSLSLVAGESLRVPLQQQILACRRAGAACRLASQ